MSLIVKRIYLLTFIFVLCVFLYNVGVEHVYTNKIKYVNYLANDRTCNPINEDYIPFQIKINNSSYPKHVSLHLNKSINFDCLNKVQKHKIILVWSEAYAAWKAFGFGKDEIFIKHKCPVTKCEITANKSRVNESDYVIVGDGSPDGLHITNPPSFRPNNQRWILLLYEAPYIAFNGNTNFSKYNGFFNLTATYLSDSDFLTTYEGTAQMTWQKNKGFKVTYSKKKKLAAALISNCWSDNSRRMDYINRLRKHIEVDVYGSCGNKNCPNSTIKNVCKELIAREYKFYLAFENSLCNDYITEKFFAILKYNIVPVVLGDTRNKYTEFVPKTGYIDVRDFNSTKDLAKYLQYLDSNKKEYYKYFDWKKYVTFTDLYRNYTVHTWGFSIFCDFCIKLHLEDFYGIEKKIINYMDSKWWTIEKNCHKSNYL